MTRDLEVLQVLEVALLTVVDHPLNHGSHTLTLERTVSEHNARRTSELSQRNQRLSHGGINVTDNLVVGVEVHVHRSGVLHLLAQRHSPQLNRRNGHSRQSNHTRVLQSLQRIGVTDSQVFLDDLNIGNDVVEVDCTS